MACRSLSAQCSSSARSRRSSSSSVRGASFRAHRARSARSLCLAVQLSCGWAWLTVDIDRWLSQSTRRLSAATWTSFAAASRHCSSQMSTASRPQRTGRTYVARRQREIISEREAMARCIALAARQLYIVCLRLTCDSCITCRRTTRTST
jgi:hypothetical protein